MSGRVVRLVRDRLFGDPAVKRVIERLAEEVDDDGAGTCPSLGELGEDCELRHETVQRVLRQARDAGLLSILPERGGILHLRLDLDTLLAQPLTGAGRRRFPGSGGPQL
jgi:DNA-binding transcriptional ArsR family regulator